MPKPLQRVEEQWLLRYVTEGYQIRFRYHGFFAWAVAAKARATPVTICTGSNDESFVQKRAAINAFVARIKGDNGSH